MFELKTAQWLWSVVASVDAALWDVRFWKVIGWAALIMLGLGILQFVIAMFEASDAAKKKELWAEQARDRQGNGYGN